MLCEASTYLGFTNNFWLTWAIITVAALVAVTIMSTIWFKLYYTNVSYETWRKKSNPNFPSPNKVRDEIIQTIKGMATATLCPTLSLWLSWRGWSKAYCGMPPSYGWSYLIATFLITTIVSDLFEWYYHRLGHVYKIFWNGVHSHHHVFSNPSPFAVVADEYLDQFARSLPLVVFPLIAPMNMDMLFFEYGIFFYAYGCVLHSGYELPGMGAHHPWLNTSFQHYCHHSRSILYKPYHTGFFFKLWDNLAGSVWTKECFCAGCAIKRGERTREEFSKIEIPDYSVLLSPAWWVSSLQADSKKASLAAQPRKAL